MSSWDEKDNNIQAWTLAVQGIRGHIVACCCGCAAGSGPHGSCKHLAALCYALEEFCRLNDTRDYVACTSKLQSWNQPRKRVLDPLPVNEIKFVKLEYGKVYTRKHETPAYDPRPAQYQHTSDSEIRSLHDKLQSISTRCALLHVLPEIDQPAPSTSVSSLPPIPRSVREKVLVEMRSSQHPLRVVAHSNKWTFFGFCGMHLVVFTNHKLPR